MTNLGKRYFAAMDGLSEYVRKMPVIFITLRPDGTTVRHRGWYPLTDVDMRLRQRMESLLEGPQLTDGRLVDETHATARRAWIDGVKPPCDAPGSRKPRAKGQPLSASSAADVTF